LEVIAMTKALQAEVPPIREDESGVLRVGDTSVLLDLVVHAFKDGATAEMIVQSYPTLNLADVYAVIAYYLRHCEEVEEYLAANEREADQIRKRIEAAQPDMIGIRERLLARRRG
jgi:uncharacterized protein (DUF433 family)